jgi:hypothetical protein
MNIKLLKPTFKLTILMKVKIRFEIELDTTITCAEIPKP